MKNMCGLCKLVGLFAIIGALNWGMIALMNMNVVAMIFGDGTMASRVVYGLVGVSGLMLLISYFKVCPACKKKMTSG